jgi:hypothetical protein
MTTPERDPLWWRVLAWLPEVFYIDCAVCLFWRGAMVGFGVACAFALAAVMMFRG